VAFRPNPGDQIEMDQVVLTFCADPQNPQQALSRFGSQSIVYQLADAQGRRQALKVFTFAFRYPVYELQPKAMVPYAGLQGMEACRRRVIVPADQPEMVIYHPELRYAVLMPWLEGQTWEEISAGKLTLTSEQRLKAARALVEVLVELERRGVAHANLNPSNVLFELPLTGPVKAHLVDMEGMYIPTLPKPDLVLVDDPRFAHPAVDTGLWDPTVDRYAGGLLLADILVSKNGDQLCMAWGEDFRDLFERIMQSRSPAECPTFAEWLEAIERAAECFEEAPAPANSAAEKTSEKPSGGSGIPWQVVSQTAAVVALISWLLPLAWDYGFRTSWIGQYILFLQVMFYSGENLSFTRSIPPILGAITLIVLILALKTPGGLRRGRRVRAALGSAGALLSGWFPGLVGGPDLYGIGAWSMILSFCAFTLATLMMKPSPQPGPETGAVRPAEAVTQPEEEAEVGKELHLEG